MICRYQIKIYFILWFASALAGVNVVVFSFAGYAPNYRCRIPYCETATNLTYHLGSDGIVPEFVLKGNLKHGIKYSKFNMLRILPNNFVKQ